MKFGSAALQNLLKLTMAGMPRRGSHSEELKLKSNSCGLRRVVPDLPR